MQYLVRLDKRQHLNLHDRAARADYATRLVGFMQTAQVPHKPHMECTGCTVELEPTALVDGDPYEPTLATLLAEALLDAMAGTSLSVVLRMRADVTTRPSAFPQDWLYSMELSEWQERCWKHGYNAQVAWGKVLRQVLAHLRDTGRVLIPYAGARSVHPPVWQGAQSHVAAYAVLLRPRVYLKVAEYLKRWAETFDGRVRHVSMAWKHHDQRTDRSAVDWHSGGVHHYTRPIPTPVDYPGEEADYVAEAAESLDDAGLRLVVQHYPPTAHRALPVSHLIENYKRIRGEPQA